MAPTDAEQGRKIGTLGTAGRAMLGLFLVGSVVEGHVSGEFRPLPWALGLLVFPAATLAWHRWTVRRSPARLRAGGILGHLGGVVVFLSLYLTWWYAPALDATSDGVLLFYGTSMLLAAARGTRGCEVLAFSNWALGRDDEVGCVLFEPVDRLERRAPRTVDSFPTERPSQSVTSEGKERRWTPPSP